MKLLNPRDFVWFNFRRRWLYTEYMTECMIYTWMNISLD